MPLADRITRSINAGLGSRIRQLSIGGEAKAWSEAGFSVADRQSGVGAVSLAFVAGKGVVGWRLEGAVSAEIDGLPIAESSPTPSDGDEPHPNGVTQIDHLVVFTPDLERTTAAFEEIGVERRRLREVESGRGPLRQGFFRLGEVILEAVEHAEVEPGPARFWGITFAVADLQTSASFLGERLGAIGDAVQPGRQIATIRAAAGLGLPVALISPP